MGKRKELPEKTLDDLKETLGDIEKPDKPEKGEKKPYKGRRRKPYRDIVKENDKFVEYYRMQKVCEEDEFDEFITSLKTDLPSTFRITGSKGEAKKMLEIVQGQFAQNYSNPNSEQKSFGMFPLPWYPNKLAWQLDLSRKDIRRCETFYKLHNFLITETEHGTISRQETVSMIPPLLLDIESHHKILDMCAAPGSKTAQLLELLHAKDDTIPTGYVIANDVDNKRCYMLVHQAKRLNSPCVAIINHDSTVLPNLRESLPDGSTQNVLFDRILCDVPCSGDGTLRKNPDIWMKWSPGSALNLHGVQYRILKRGFELLKVGGRLVYSTCSINPIENEAVIHRLLVETEGTMELVDIKNTLPGLKHAPGMEKWLVGSKNLEFYENIDQVDEKWLTTIRPQMFPPKTEDLSKFNLNRCVRILPHHQNTGAFFVAVLEKKSKEEFKIKTKIDDEILPENPRKKPKNEGYREDPFVFFKGDEEAWTQIQAFYEINNKFDPTTLLTRCHKGKKKNIYVTSEPVRDLVLQNQDHIKFINTGVKAFARCDNKYMDCPFRVGNDGLETLYPFVGEGRKVPIPKEDLLILLMSTDPTKPPPATSLTKGVQDRIEKLGIGSCILVYTEKMENQPQPLVLYISGWRGLQSLRCYMSYYSTVHLIRLLGGDVTAYINKFKKIEGEDGDEEKMVE